MNDLFGPHAVADRLNRFFGEEAMPVVVIPHQADRVLMEVREKGFTAKFSVQVKNADWIAHRACDLHHGVRIYRDAPGLIPVP